MHTQANSAPPRHLIRKLRPFLALACSFAAASLLHSQTTWIGGVDDDNIWNAGNWSNGVPANPSNPATISSGTPVWRITNANGKTITQTGGTFSVVTTTNLTLQNGGQGHSTYNLNGGTFNITGRFNLGDGATFNVNGGNLNQVAAEGVTTVLWLNHGGADMNINSDLTTDVRIDNRSGTFTVNGAAFQINDFVLGANASAAYLNLQGGANMNVTAFQSLGTGKLISFADGANAFSADAWSGNGLGTTTFDFASSSAGSSITITTGAWDEATWEVKWAGGLLKVDGANSGTFSDHFTVSGDTLTYVGLIPEPSSFALIGALGALAFAGARRHRRAL